MKGVASNKMIMKILIILTMLLQGIQALADDSEVSPASGTTTAPVSHQATPPETPVSYDNIDSVF